MSVDVPQKRSLHMHARVVRAASSNPYAVHALLPLLLLRVPQRRGLKARGIEVARNERTKRAQFLVIRAMKVHPERPSVIW